MTTHVNTADLDRTGTGPGGSPGRMTASGHRGPTIGVRPEAGRSCRDARR
ncbi:hypothetical protein ACFQYP_13880 [Nonomuraea antimicrobica]